MTDNLHPGSSKVPPSLPGIELHACEQTGRWVAVTERPVYPDVVHRLWMEGYQLGFTPLETGAMQVVVSEGLSDAIRNAVEEEA